MQHLLFADPHAHALYDFAVLVAGQLGQPIAQFFQPDPDVVLLSGSRHTRARAAQRRRIQGAVEDNDVFRVREQPEVADVQDGLFGHADSAWVMRRGGDVPIGGGHGGKFTSPSKKRGPAAAAAAAHADDDNVNIPSNDANGKPLATLGPTYASVKNLLGHGLPLDERARALDALRANQDPVTGAVGAAQRADNEYFRCYGPLLTPRLLAQLRRVVAQLRTLPRGELRRTPLRVLLRSEGPAVHLAEWVALVIQETDTQSGGRWLRREVLERITARQAVMRAYFLQAPAAAALAPLADDE